MQTALVVGGTGSSGSLVVQGLLERGADVTILHSGKHEIDFSRAVEHIHADPHFKESLQAALSNRSFDLTISMYGRTRFVADLMRGRTLRLIHAGGTFYQGWVDARLLTRGQNGTGAWEPSFEDVPLVATEETPLESSSRFTELAVQTEREVLLAHDRGDYQATIIRYPQLYGPMQPAPIEWSIIQRARDRREVILLPGDGLLLSTRCYSRNAADVILAAVDHPGAAAGEIFNAGDPEAITVRQWVTIIARAIGASFRFVGVPYSAGSLVYSYSLFPWNATHRVLSVEKAQSRLGYRPLAAAVGLAETARWYFANPLVESSSESAKLGDAFDYAGEDRLMAAIEKAIRSAGGQSVGYTHPYEHPAS